MIRSLTMLGLLLAAACTPTAFPSDRETSGPDSPSTKLAPAPLKPNPYLKVEDIVLSDGRLVRRVTIIELDRR